MNPEIRTVDRDTLRGIFDAGKPAGLWMACVSERYHFWMGIDTRSGRAEYKEAGAFSKVLTWMLARGGVKPASSPANINQTNKPFVGWRVTAAGVRRVTKTKKSKNYTGFSPSDFMPYKFSVV